MDALYLDFQKAFDKVSHEKLVLKMKRMGLEDGIVRWIENWLSDRRKRVESGVWNLDGKGLRVGCHRGRFWGRCCSLFLLMI